MHATLRFGVMKRRTRAGRAVPLADVSRHRRRRLWTKRLSVVALLVAVAVADHCGWLLYRGEARRYDNQWVTVVAVVDGEANSGLVYHTYMVALIDRDGMVRYRYIGVVDPEEVIIGDIEFLLEESR